MSEKLPVTMVTSLKELQIFVSGPTLISTFGRLRQKDQTSGQPELTYKDLSSRGFNIFVVINFVNCKGIICC